jgi:hypothetical protein
MLRISNFYVLIKNCGMAVYTPATALYYLLSRNKYGDSESRF